jgi:hypothetical protein
MVLVFCNLGEIWKGWGFGNIVHDMENCVTFSSFFTQVLLLLFNYFWTEFFFFQKWIEVWDLDMKTNCYHICEYHLVR